MRAEQQPTPLRVPRTAGERMVEVAAELDQLSRMLGRVDGAGTASRFAGSIAWRLLVVREMVRVSPAQAVLAAERFALVDGALVLALAAAGWGRCRDLDEALSDLQTILGDIGDAVQMLPEPAGARMTGFDEEHGGIMGRGDAAPSTQDRADARGNLRPALPVLSAAGGGVLRALVRKHR